MCIYSVCVAHACDIVEPGQIVSTVGTLLFSWAAGVTIGPLFGAAAMELIGPQGLFIYAALASLGLAPSSSCGSARVQRPPAKGGFADIAPTSSASATLTPRAEARGSAVKCERVQAAPSDQKVEASAVARADTSS